MPEPDGAHAQSSQAEEAPRRADRALSDSKLTGIPHSVLGRAAKDVYRARRQLAGGGRRSFPKVSTLMDLMGCSRRTVQRGDAQLVEKGFARVLYEPGGGKFVQLLDGPVGGDNLSRGGDKTDTPLNKEGGKEKRESSFKEQLSLFSTEAAAEPSPAETGSAEAEEELEPLEVRLRRTDELRARFVDVLLPDCPQGKPAGDGRCDGCKRERNRELLGALALCRECRADRYRIALKAAASVARAESGQ